MSEKTLTAMSWNLQGEVGIGDPRLDKIFEFIQQCFAMVSQSEEGVFDLLLLQAVPHSRCSDVRKRLQAELGYPSQGVVDTLGWAKSLDGLSCQPHHDLVHNRGNVIASRWEAERIPLSIHNQPDFSNFYTNFPEKIL